MAMFNLKPVMKEKNLDPDDRKPGLLKKKFGPRPSQSTEVQKSSSLMKRLTGK